MVEEITKASVRPASDDRFLTEPGAFSKKHLSSIHTSDIKNVTPLYTVDSLRLTLIKWASSIY